MKTLYLIILLEFIFNRLRHFRNRKRHRRYYKRAAETGH